MRGARHAPTRQTVDRMPLTPLVVYDATERSALGLTWRAYASTFPDSFAVTDWAEVAQLQEDLPGRDLQVWGHGLPGRPLIDGKAPRHRHPWHLSRSAWFRSCSVAAEPTFLAHVAQSTYAAAHTGIVGTWACQSRLYGLRPRERPWWPQHDPREHSHPFLPRTVPAWQRRLPAWAFQRQLP